MAHRHPRGHFLRHVVAGAATVATAGFPLVTPAKRAPAEADTSKLYQAAKKEGTVVWWTSEYTQNVCENIRAAFKAKYPGVDVSLLRQTTQILNSRVLQDFKAGISEVDVFGTTDEAHYASLKKLGALAEHAPPDINKLPQRFQALDPDQQYHLGSLGFVVLNYNPKKVVPPPQRWADLLDPRWKGQVSLGHPAYSGYVALWAVTMSDRYGWDSYFKRLEANRPKIGRSIFEVVVDIVSGESQIASGTDKSAYEKKAAGNQIDVQFPQDEAILVAAPVAVLKNAPHPNAARLMANFYYSKEFSETIAKTFDYPLRTDVAPANGLRLNRIKYHRVPLERQITGIPEVIAKWRETFGV